jgi:uncharacterized membrane protein YkvA (DUF1232 family)
MNHELKQTLKTMASRHDPAVAVFRALFRRRAGEDAPKVEQAIRNMILMMPETLELVRLRSTAPGMPGSVKRVHGHLLNYLYEPKDIIPEEGNGFYGYMDDAYLVTEANRRLSGSFEPWINEWLDAASRVMPAETVQLDAMLDGLLGAQTKPYEKALGN